MLDLLDEMYALAHLHLKLRIPKFKLLSRSLHSSPQLYTLDTEIFRTIPEHTGVSVSKLSFIKNSSAHTLRIVPLSSRGVHTCSQRAQFEDWDSVGLPTWRPISLAL